MQPHINANYVMTDPLTLLLDVIQLDCGAFFAHVTVPIT